MPRAADAGGGACRRCRAFRLARLHGSPARSARHEAAIISLIDGMMLSFRDTRLRPLLPSGASRFSCGGRRLGWLTGFRLRALSARFHEFSPSASFRLERYLLGAMRAGRWLSLGRYFDDRLPTALATLAPLKMNPRGRLAWCERFSRSGFRQAFRRPWPPVFISRLS